MRCVSEVNKQTNDDLTKLFYHICAFLLTNVVDYTVVCS